MVFDDNLPSLEAVQHDRELYAKNLARSERLQKIGEALREEGILMAQESMSNEASRMLKRAGKVLNLAAVYRSQAEQGTTILDRIERMHMERAARLGKERPT